MNQLNFLNLLLQRLPELERLHEEHIKDNDVLLPFVFLSEIVRYLEANYENDLDAKFLEELISLLNASFEEADDELKELISVSFLENLSKDNDIYQILKNNFSNALKKELSLYDY